MRKSIFYISLIVTRGFDQSTVPRHLVVLPVALVVWAVLENENSSPRAVTVLVVSKVGARLVFVGALLVGVGLGKVGEGFEETFDLEHFGV